MKHCILFLIFSSVLFGQRIDNYLTQSGNSSHQIVLSYDNDLFRNTDIYYTQGISLDVVTPVFIKNPLNKVLLSIKDADKYYYGIHMESDVFTPTSIQRNFIDKNDRPFASTIAITSYQSSMSIEKGRKITAALQLGMIGPATLGKEMQTEIHKLTKDPIPIGWDNQIQNDLVLNYTLQIQQQLWQQGSWLNINTTGAIDIGTLHTNATAGIEIYLGWRNGALSTQKRKFECYLYSQTLGRLVGYDATLLGGMFNQSSTYILSYSRLRHWVGEQHIGLALNIANVYFALDGGFLSAEFDTANSHSWGGIRMGMNIQEKSRQSTVNNNLK